MSQDTAETGSERQPDLGMDLDLVNPLRLIFNGVLDRDDLRGGIFDFV